MTRTIIQTGKIFSARQAPRVLTTHAVGALLAAAGHSMPPSTLARFINKMTGEGFFRRVNSGLYLNDMANPAPILDEAAGFIRNGAIISLQRALGLHGVANNPSEVITAVVPINALNSNPRLGTVETELGVFQFRGIKSHIYENTHTDLQQCFFNRPIPGSVPVATAEQSLVDWVYLASNPRSNMTEPPAADMDLTLLNLKKLKTLANAAGIGNEMQAWLFKAKAIQNNDWDDQAHRLGISA